MHAGRPEAAADAVTTASLEFTGERFVPGTQGEIAHEHWHRYAFARRFVGGRRVADVACGEGYGSALLARDASTVVGVDIDPRAVAHASAEYGNRSNLRFTAGSAIALPLAAGSVDAVVSFETIEHLPREAQSQMLAEFARVLAPDGVLVMSSPNRPQYSEARDYRNPFHMHELDRAELAALLATSFPACRWYRQRRYLGSALWSEDGGDGYEVLAGNARSVDDAAAPEAMYFVVIAARTPAALPASAPALSFFGDADETEWQRIEAQAREVLRLDALLKSRDEALATQGAHVVHLEGLVAFRDRIVAERDEQLAALNAAAQDAADAIAALRADLGNVNAELGSARQASEALEAERQRLERAIAAQERIIAYRQSARWWMQLPWLRVRNLWQKVL
jgi:SAM-dependent methyltransferase